MTPGSVITVAALGGFVGWVLRHEVKLWREQNSHAARRRLEEEDVQERRLLAMRVEAEARRREASRTALLLPVGAAPAPRRLPSFEQVEAIFALPSAPGRDAWCDPAAFRAARDAIRRLPEPGDQFRECWD